MKNDPHRGDKHETAQQLPIVDDAYAFDPSAEIYKPKSVTASEERNREHPGSNRNRRFFTDPRTDWAPIIGVSLPISLFTIGLLFVTAGLTFRQWRTMNKTYEEIQKQTSAVLCSAEAAQRSASAAEQANKNAVRSLEQTERAWVGFDINNLNVRIKNFGRGVASDVVDWIILYPSHGKIPDIKKWLETNINSYAHPENDGVLFPDVSIKAISHTSNRDETLQQWTQNPFIKSGEAVPYLIGHVTYVTFGKTHSTDFCVIYVPDQNAFGFKNDDEGCKTFNRAD